MAETIALCLIGNAGVQIEKSTQSGNKLLTELVIPATDDICTAKPPRFRQSMDRRQFGPPAALPLCSGNGV